MFPEMLCTIAWHEALYNLGVINVATAFARLPQHVIRSRPRYLYLSLGGIRRSSLVSIQPLINSGSLSADSYSCRRIFRLSNYTATLPAVVPGYLVANMAQLVVPGPSRVCVTMTKNGHLH